MPLELKDTPPYYTTNTNSPPANKIYQAILSQTGTNAPTAQILQNTIGTIVWTRAAEGHYQGTLTGAFPNNKTMITTTIDWKTANAVAVYSDRFTDDIIDITTYSDLGTTPDELDGTGVNITIQTFNP